MDQQTPSAPSSTNPTMSDSSPPKYVPQFSAATEMILKRIQSGTSSSALSSIGITGTPPGYEDMRRNVLMGMKTSMNMEIPSTPIGGAKRGGAARNASSTGRKARAVPSSDTPRASSLSSGLGSASAGKRKKTAKPRGKAGSKRKRNQEEESDSTTEESDTMSKLGGDSDSDEDTESITDLPKITQSGRQINKPAQFVPAAYEPPAKRRNQPKRNQEQALCKRCGRGHSPQSNMIVFCDGCNLGWHQQCHDPAITEETVKDESAPWFCGDCGRKRGVKSTGTSWQGRSADDKRAYFNSLQPQQLVSLLMQATVLHPNIPIFPSTHHMAATSTAPKASNSRANAQPQQPFPPSAASASGLFSRSDANPRAQMNFIRKIPPGSTPPANLKVATETFAHASSAPPTLNVQGGDNTDSRESTPASPPYPRPGNGLMAKLGPDVDDIEWLVDDNDFDAFSHTVYDDNGNGQAQVELVNSNENGTDHGLVL